MTTATTLTMKIAGDTFVEAKATTPMHPVYGSCSQCAFGQRPRQCLEAVKNGPAIFGGDCEQRDVIYVRAEGQRA